MHARTHLPQSYADAHPPSPPYFAASSLIDGATSACACMHFESIALDLYSSAQSTPARIKARESAFGGPCRFGAGRLSIASRVSERAYTSDCIHTSDCMHPPDCMHSPVWGWLAWHHRIAHTSPTPLASERR